MKVPNVELENILRQEAASLGSTLTSLSSVRSVVDENNVDTVVYSYETHSMEFKMKATRWAVYVNGKQAASSIVSTVFEGLVNVDK